MVDTSPLKRESMTQIKCSLDLKISGEIKKKFQKISYAVHVKVNTTYLLFQTIEINPVLAHGLSYKLAVKLEFTDLDWKKISFALNAYNQANIVLNDNGNA